MQEEGYDVVEAAIGLVGAAGAALALWSFPRGERQPVVWGLAVAAASGASGLGIIDLADPIRAFLLSDLVQDFLDVYA
ncbi:hypothetical protein ACWD3I_25460 [Streptomyces sp. NPDC002817]|uniref:hypothetical protein n=1 Tax=Streptomyces sp. NPDC088357 TaxID=3154655 RepID=UPI003426C632